MSNPTRFEEIVIGGPELAPTTGMRHVHIYVAFEHAKSMSQIDRIVQLIGYNPWCELASKNDRERIIKHHTKVLTKEDANVLELFRFPERPIEVNDTEDERPLKKARTSGLELRAAIETGDIDVVKDLNYMVYIKSKSSIEAECAKFRPKTDDQVFDHLWIVGDTGKGKTAFIKRTWPNAYWKDCCNPNFEEYNNEDVVVLDDFDNKRLRLMTPGKLKNLCNPAGDRCKINYGSCYVKARIIVTSQYSIRECFVHKGKQKFTPNPDWGIQEPSIDEDRDYHAIRRRFKEVTIDQLLFDNNLQLKSKADIRALTPQQQAEYDVFEEYNPHSNREVDAYSECNQSSIMKDASTQTESVHMEDDTTTTSTMSTTEACVPFSCTDSQCKLKGIWVGNPSKHIHNKYQD